jgi:iron complex outermembrane recepter protein
MKIVGYSVSAALLAGASMVAMPQAAMAQAAAAAEDDGGLSEIVVTAQKRGENLQQAPLAISAISAEQIDLQGISEARDLSALAPNVNIIQGTTNATAAVIAIRGIPTPADETQGFDTPIGLYLDGVYLARSSAASFEVADIERVEVLRGPQGTLFGRNTTGGAINFITKEPSEDASLKVRLGVGNYDQRAVRAILNSGTIGDSTRISLGFVHKQRSGVVDNILQPKDRLDPGGNNIDSARLAIVVNLSDSIKISNTFDYTFIRGVPHANQLAGVGTGLARPNLTIDGGTFSQPTTAAVGPFLASATALDPRCGPLSSQVSQRRLDSICLDTAKPSNDELYGDMFRVEVDLSGAKIRSTTAYRKWNNEIEGSDLDGLGQFRGARFTQASLLNGLPAPLLTFILPAAQRPFAPFIAATPVPTTTHSLFNATNDRHQKQFSQELEIVSDTDGAFQWVLGGFYFRESGNETNAQFAGAVVDTNAIFIGNFGALGPSLAAANPAPYRLFENDSILQYSARGTSVAVYGQGSYRPGGKDGAFGVTLGLRYTWDRKSLQIQQNGAAAFVTPADIGLNTGKANFKAPTGHLTVDYRAGDDVNLYVRAARGYRSGGFNARQTAGVKTVGTGAAATTVNIPLVPFGNEKIWSFEAGVKTEFFDRLRLNAAVFFNKYTNQQITVPVPVSISGGGSFGTIVVNAGKTDYVGFELEGLFKLSSNFTLDGNFGYVHRKIKEFPGVDIGGTTRNIASILKPANAPSTTAAVGLTGNYPMGGDAKLTGRVGMTYAGATRFFSNPIGAPFNEAIKSGAHTLVDAQLRVDGIKMGGSSFGVTFWGKNITNKNWVARGIDFTAGLGIGTTIYADPRTYGLTLDFGF